MASFTLVNNGNQRSAAAIRVIALRYLAVLGLWWSVLATAKFTAEAASFPEKSSLSFPGPLAPMIWLIVNQQEDRYQTAVVSYPEIIKTKVRKQATASRFNHDQLCLETRSPAADQAFAQYKLWASYVVCEPLANRNNSCQCHSLRYAFDLNSSRPYFGTVTINREGQIKFVPPDRQGSWQGMVKAWQ